MTRPSISNKQSTSIPRDKTINIEQAIVKYSKGQYNQCRISNRQVFQGTMGSGNRAIGQQTIDEYESTRQVSINNRANDIERQGNKTPEHRGNKIPWTDLK